MYLTQVRTEKDKLDFIQLPVEIYKNDKNWIRPLDKDIEFVFDKEQNKYFTHGEAIRWIAKDENGLPIGRVAAFINYKTAGTFEQPTGGMGFFECHDNKKAAVLLFDAAKAWLTGKGMDAMDGPINFGEKDKWWGLLVEGFHEPTYCSNYNPPYYQQFFDEYGFKPYYEQYNFTMKVHDPLPEKYVAFANRVGRNPEYKCQKIEKNNLKKYAEDFRIIYNKGWVKHENFKEMSQAQAVALVKSMKPIIDEDLIWFCYHNNQPIGFFVMLPELNQIFKYLNGKFNLFAKLKFAWYKWRGSCKKIFGMAFGVIPEFQGKGIESFLIMAAAAQIQSTPKYLDFEMTWIGDFNPRMLHLVETLGANKYRTYVTYRKLFDESKPFTRAPIIN